MTRSAVISNTNPCNSSPQSVYPRAVRARQSARVYSEAREPGLVPRVLPGLDHHPLERGGQQVMMMIYNDDDNDNQ